GVSATFARGPCLPVPPQRESRLMAIRFVCECGQQLSAREEYAGKRVKCTACQTLLIVPSPEDEAPAPKRSPQASAKPPAMIRFICECGRQMQAKAEFAGKKTKCTGCGTLLIIPDLEDEEPAEEEAPPPRRRESIQSSRPSRGSSRAGRDDDDDERDERPRRRRDDD